MTSGCSMNARIRMAPTQRGQTSGSTSYTCVISRAHARFATEAETSSKGCKVTRAATDYRCRLAPWHRMASRLALELSELLGRKVDLRTAAELSRYFREEVVGSGEIQYAQA